MSKEIAENYPVSMTKYEYKMICMAAIENNKSFSQYIIETVIPQAEHDAGF